MAEGLKEGEAQKANDAGAKMLEAMTKGLKKDNAKDQASRKDGCSVQPIIACMRLLRSTPSYPHITILPIACRNIAPNCVTKYVPTKSQQTMHHLYSLMIPCIHGTIIHTKGRRKQYTSTPFIHAPMHC